MAKMSNYEKQIYEYLKKLFPNFNIKCHYQMSNFANCPKRFRRMHVDFYIPEFNLAIEVDGEHHERKVVYNDEIKAQVDFERRQSLDTKKEIFLAEIGVKLLRIKYHEIKDLKWFEEIIDSAIKEDRA